MEPYARNYGYRDCRPLFTPAFPWPVPSPQVSPHGIAELVQSPPCLAGSSTHSAWDDQRRNRIAVGRKYNSGPEGNLHWICCRSLIRIWPCIDIVVLEREKVRLARAKNLGGSLPSCTSFLSSFLSPTMTRVRLVECVLFHGWFSCLEGFCCIFQRECQALLRIFISEHKWKNSQPTEEEAIIILNQGDDSSIPVPAVFMFVLEMSVIVN